MSECATKCYRCSGTDCVVAEEVCRNSLSFCQVKKQRYFSHFWSYPLFTRKKVHGHNSEQRRYLSKSNNVCIANNLFYFNLKKVTTSTAGVNVYVKGCADSCVDGNTYTFGPSTIGYKCCTTDNCNISMSNFQFSKALTLLSLLMPIVVCKGFWRNLISFWFDFCFIYLIKIENNDFLKITISNKNLLFLFGPLIQPK